MWLHRLIGLAGTVFANGSGDLNRPRLWSPAFYKPGYIYGTVKIHKPGYPLRLIISQVTTPTYQLTKTINHLITPYLSHNYSFKSTKELIEILKTHKPNKEIISSRDMENLFTNVPVLKTINIIINNISHHPTLPPPKINTNTLRKILYSAPLRYYFTIPKEIYSSKKMELQWCQFWDPFSVTFNRDIGPAVRVFANGPGDLGSIPGRVIPKTLKMELDTTLLNTQHYKVRFKGKVEQSWEWSSALPYTLV